ncbi:MAG: class I SAM-dependent methyltransferase [Candidatus Hydrogenedentota bacterium]
MGLRNADSAETEKTWKGYYSSLAGQTGSDKFREEFDRYTYVHTWHNSVRVINRYARILNGDKILDAGCGWGRLLLGVLESHHDLDITAIDLQQDALNLGKSFIGEENNGNKITWQQENLTSLSLPDASFDVVYSARVFQHLDVPPEGIAELLRVLKPGGRFLIFLQNSLCPLNKGYYARMYSPAQVRAWFDTNPVQQLSVSTMDFYPGNAAKLLPLPIRMGFESILGAVPFLNRYGGKVAAWGVK